MDDGEGVAQRLAASGGHDADQFGRTGRGGGGGVGAARPGLKAHAR